MSKTCSNAPDGLISSMGKINSSKLKYDVNRKEFRL